MRLLLTAQDTSLKTSRYVVREGELAATIPKTRRRSLFVALFNDCLLLARPKSTSGERLQLVAHWPLCSLRAHLSSAASQLVVFLGESDTACALFDVWILSCL